VTGGLNEGVPELTSGSVVCTVAEGTYHFGVAALCNSLHRQGFRGQVWVGWRGPLPEWATAADGAGPWKELVVDDEFSVRFVAMDGSRHLANCKPAFFRRVLDELAPEATALFYFDSDVVVRGRWEFFEEWITHGIALLQDVWDPAMLPSHIFKKRWKAHATRLGYQCRDVAGYYNSGFVGLRREDAGFVEVWEDIVASIPSVGGDLHAIKLADPNHLFYKMDQDALNVAVLAANIEIATGSREMMEIFPWSAVIAHAIDFKKPWKRNYLLDAAQGFPPGRPHLAYWQNVDGPIRAYSRGKLAMKRVEVGMARVIGRAHHRSLYY
jgi:hypothetical protein